MKQYRSIVFSILGGMLLFLLFLSVGVYWFGGFNQFFASINGESVVLSPNILDLGNCEANAETVAVFKMTNLSSQEISVVGGRTSCNCAMPEGLPISIGPGKTVDLNVKVYLPKYESSYNQTIVFMIAEPNKLGMYPVQITATIPNPLPLPVDNIESVTIPIDTVPAEDKTISE